MLKSTSEGVLAPLPATKRPPNFSPHQGLNQEPTASPTNGASAAKINTFNKPKYYKPTGGAITHVKRGADILSYMRENSSLHIVRVLEKSCLAITDSYCPLVLASRRCLKTTSNVAILKLERKNPDFIAEVGASSVGVFTQRWSLSSYICWCHLWSQTYIVWIKPPRRRCSSFELNPIYLQGYFFQHCDSSAFYKCEPKHIITVAYSID